MGIQVWQTRHISSGPPPITARTEPVALVDGGVLSVDHSLESALSALRVAHPESPIAVHIWAEWCTICRLEEGNVSALAKDTPVITIAMQSGNSERVAQILEDRGLDWLTLVDPKGSLAQALGASSVPLFLVIDRQGHVRVPTVGYTSLWGMRLRLFWARFF